MKKSDSTLGAVPKLFVVGVGRSGTSLLQAMLASHSQICFLPETSFVRRFLVTGSLTKLAKSAGHAKVAQTLSDDSRFARLGFTDWPMDSSSSHDPWIEKTLYEKIARSRVSAECRYLGDKDPRCVEIIDIIQAIWPDCRIVHIYRDPRDVLASKKKAEWSQHKSVFYQLVAGNSQFHLGRVLGNQLPPDSVHALCYEKLLQHPEETLTALCKWLALEFEPNMLSFGTAASDLVSQEEMPWKKTTLGPLLTNNVNKWQGSLTDFETRATERICREAMTMGHYQAAVGHSNLSLIQRLALRPFAWIARGIAQIYIWRRIRKNRRLINQLRQLSN